MEFIEPEEPALGVVKTKAFAVLDLNTYVSPTAIDEPKELSPSTVPVVNIEPESAEAFEQKITYLQKRFMDVVKDMQDNQCPLPDSFELFYKIMQNRDRGETVFDITPFLTRTVAENAVNEANEIANIYVDPKNDINVHYFVGDSTMDVKTEHYSTNHTTKHQVNFLA